MITTINAQNASSAWLQALDAIRLQGSIQEGRDQPTIEIPHAAISISDPRQRLVFSRVINPAFAVAETLWILSGGNKLGFLTFWNRKMADFSDDGKSLYGAYGWRLGSNPMTLSEDVMEALYFDTGMGMALPEIDQLYTAYEALSNNPDSRQVVLQIWNADLDMPNYGDYGEPRSKDVPCNVLGHLLIRDGRLDWLQVMRSNDLIWGLPYNIVQWTMIQETLAGWLGVELGSYNHIANSLHVYKRHWRNYIHSTEKIIDHKYKVENTADLRLPYERWKEVMADVMDIAVMLTEVDKDALLAEFMPYVMSVGTELRIPVAYYELIALLTAEALRIHGCDPEALVMIRDAGTYYARSWMLWYEFKARHEHGE